MMDGWLWLVGSRDDFVSSKNEVFFKFDSKPPRSSHYIFNIGVATWGRIGGGWAMRKVLVGGRYVRNLCMM